MRFLSVVPVDFAVLLHQIAYNVNMHDRKEELRNGSIGKLLFKYSMPAIIGMMVNALYNVVDMVFIGQGAGSDALAALSICFPIQMFCLAIAHLVGIGAASIISRRLGAGDSLTANKTAGTAFTVVSAFAIIMVIVVLSFMDPIIRLFGATDLIAPYCRDYLTYIMFGAFFFCFTACTNNIARSEGSAAIAMTCMIIGAGVNAILDPIFIFDWGFGLGIKGAAISTMIANICTFTFMVIYFVKGNTMLEIKWKYLKPYWKVIPEMLGIGMSSFARVMAGSFAAIVINNAIIVVGTEIHLAMLGVSTRVMIFMLMPLFGLVHGMQPILGFNYGAGAMDRAKNSLKLAMKAAVIYCLGFFVITRLFAHQIVSIFGDDIYLLTEGPAVLKLLLLLLPLIGFAVVGASVFQAIGKAAIALFLSTLRQVLILVPLVFILPKFYGITGIWISYPISDFITAVIIGLFVFREIRILGNYKVPGVGTGT